MSRIRAAKAAEAANVNRALALALRSPIAAAYGAEIERAHGEFFYAGNETNH